MIHQTIVDHLVFALLLLIPLIEWKWNWPRYLARLASGDTNARLSHYRKLIVGEWILTIGFLVYWVAVSRKFGDLRLTGDTPLRFGLGLGYVLLLIGMLMWQRRALLARPDRRARVRKALAYGVPLLPHSERERRIFWAVSVTAGFCEEIFYRGFLTWYLSVWMGPVAAVLLASLIFGAGHVYLGIAQVPKTAFIGLIFAIVVSLTGSLWPAMLLHAAVDWNSGELGFKLVRGNPSSELPAA
ncbi:MAG: CPBP family intramembrane glutamic endopeptidase [Terracidiphilus sp.]